jgi:hypothetical protein
VGSDGIGDFIIASPGVKNRQAEEDKKNCRHTFQSGFPSGHCSPQWSPSSGGPGIEREQATARGDTFVVSRIIAQAAVIGDCRLKNGGDLR